MFRILPSFLSHSRPAPGHTATTHTADARAGRTHIGSHSAPGRPRPREQQP